MYSQETGLEYEMYKKLYLFTLSLVLRGFISRLSNFWERDCYVIGHVTQGVQPTVDSLWVLIQRFWLSVADGSCSPYVNQLRGKVAYCNVSINNLVFSFRRWVDNGETYPKVVYIATAVYSAYVRYWIL